MGQRVGEGMVPYLSYGFAVMRTAAVRRILGGMSAVRSRMEGLVLLGRRLAVVFTTALLRCADDWNRHVAAHLGCNVAFLFLVVCPRL